MAIEQFTLEDGRRAERRTSVNEAGETVVEVYAEEAKPLRLEKRITEKRKDVLAEQIVETLKDGTVTDRVVNSIEAPTLEPRGQIDLTPLAPMIAQAVIAGIQATQPVKAQSIIVTKAEQTQLAIEERVQASQKSETRNYITCGIIIALEIVAVVAALIVF